jgi:hypothetical protein
MKYLKFVLFILALSIALSAQLDTNSQHYYMYIHFMHANNGEKLGARLAFSTDGTTWQQYKDGAPVIVPNIAVGEEPLMRDPNVFYDSTTGVFHLTWTTGWKQDNIGYASSKDLLNWSEQIMIPIGQKINGCSCCWAPQFFYDDIKDSVMVYWSTDRGATGKEAFYSMTKNFINYTNPNVYFAPKNADGQGYSIIDESILKVADNKYYLFFKDERKTMEAGHIALNVHFVFGTSPQGPWWKGSLDEVSYPISVTGREGPTACIIGDDVRVYYDPFLTITDTDRSKKIKLTELLGDEPPASTAWIKGDAMKTVSGADFLPAHGSVTEVPRAKVMQVLYGIADQTVYPKKWTHPLQSQITVGETVTDPITPVTPDTVRDYPMGKQNTGCGTGFGLAFIPAIAFKGMSMRKRRRQNNRAKAK